MRIITSVKSLFRLGIGDIIAVLLTFAVMTAFGFIAAKETSGPPRVIIESGNETYIYPLDRDAEIRIPGPLGDSIIQIENNGVRFIDSPCRDKLCVGMGVLKKNRDWAACLPNKVSISIEGIQDESAPDIVAY